jgi:hypothetical protein
VANANRASRLSSIVVACLATCGCAAYHPTIQPVKAQTVKPEDATYDCSQLEAAILRVDTVRWVIRDDGGTLETSGHQAARFAGNLFLILGGGIMGDDGNAVLNAADQRICYLLRLKRDQGCPASATSEPGMTDLQMLEVLGRLMPPNRTADRHTLDQRTLLLDHLRAPLPAPSASSLPTP